MFLKGGAGYTLIFPHCNTDIVCLVIELEAVSSSQDEAASDQRPHAFTSFSFLMLWYQEREVEHTYSK